MTFELVALQKTSYGIMTLISFISLDHASYSPLRLLHHRSFSGRLCPPELGAILEGRLPQMGHLVRDLNLLKAVRREAWKSKNAPSSDARSP